MSGPVKTCSKCKAALALSEFSPFGPSRPGKYKSHCKACACAWVAAKYAANPAMKHRAAELRAARPGAGAAATRKYRETHPHSERERVIKLAWTRANKEKLNATRRDKRAADPVRYRAVRVQHYRANRGKVLAEQVARKAAKLRATPAWADTQATAAFYVGAPNGVEVDHVVPLRSALVCGLHWRGNLQYLTPRENRAKGNRRWPDMPEGRPA